MFGLTTTDKSKFYSAIATVVTIQFILMFQGFDVCDDGFVLSSYQQIFKSPSSVEYNFVYWLSTIIGGLWYRLYEDGGILWFRVLALIINTLTFVVSYKVLKPYAQTRFLLLGLVMVLFSNDFGFLTYYHNHITALLAVTSIYFLVKGISKEKAVLVCLAGCITAINVFSRLPNITLFVFVLAIPFTFYVQKKSLSQSIKPMVVFFFGAVLGFISVYIALYSLGQTEMMKNALFGLVDLGKTEGSTHNVGGLFKTYVYDYIQLFIRTAELILVMILILASMILLKLNRFLKLIIFTGGFIIIIFWFKIGDIYTLYAMATIGVFGTLFTKEKSYHTKLIAFLALLMMFFLPLGSGGGIASSGYMCIWLATPLFFHVLIQFTDLDFNYKTEFENYNIQITSKSLNSLCLVLLLGFFIVRVYTLSNGAYFDEGSRFNKTYAINNKLAKGIYTTKERAIIINELLLNLKNYVEPNDYLLAYDNIPMVHFLTETKPYMYNPWIWIYDSYSFEKNLKRAESNIDVLPIIIQQKFETIGKFSEPVTDYLLENHESSVFFDRGRIKTMNSFISRNDYHIVWSNAYFNIYKSYKNTKSQTKE